MTTSDRYEQRAYRLYLDFFARAERERRWDPFRDVPWEALDRGPRANDALATVAETFCAVESYLPDYVAQGIALVRPHFGQAWFAANWAYEESKHSLVLMDYLVRSGQRTEEQMFGLQATLRTRTWQMPFATPRRMTIYGGLQEMATFVIYCRQEARAKAEGDGVLAKIFRFIARDEIEHAHFYQDVVRALLEEDREGTLADLAHVTAHFEMPGVGLVPDYDARVEVMRQAGIDRALFLRKVFLPMLTHLGVDRAEVVRAARRDGEPTPIFPAQASAAAS